MRRVVALAALLRLASACPYSGMKATTILVANGLCPSTKMPCLVNATCALMGVPPTTSKYNDSSDYNHALYYGLYYNVDAVGDMTGFANSKLLVDVGPMQNTDLSHMKLPTGLQTFLVENYQGLDANMTWPPALDFLSLFRGKTPKAPPLPLTVTKVSLNSIALTTMPDMGPNLTYLNLGGNVLKVMAHVDLSNVRYVSLGNNAINTITNVTFSNALEYFACTEALSTFNLANASYQALNRLTKSSTNRIGYDVSATFKTVLDDAACIRSGGRIEPLWARDAPGSYSVCVTPGTELIVGVTVGVVILLLLLSSFYCIWKRRRARSGSTDSTLPTETVLQGVDMEALQLLRLERKDLVVVTKAPLAAGAYGEVWRGTYDDQPVAIKRTKDKSAKAIAKMASEIRLLSRMQCPYIVALVGASWSRLSDLECVVEYMDLGDLRSYLASTSPATFPWSQKQASVSSVVQGLLFLHTFDVPIIHRDIKSRNILLDSKKGTKLTDFGESREMDESTLTNGIGTYQWMAPEIFKGHDYSTAADVYSFGVLLAEYSTHQVPYTDRINPRTNKPMNQQYVMAQVMAGELMPTFDTTTTPSWVVDLATECLAVDPNERPTMLLIASRMLHVVSCDL